MTLPRALQRLIARFPLAWGWKQSPTVTEQKTDAYQSYGARYTRTQEADVQKLAITPKPLKLVRRA